MEYKGRLEQVFEQLRVWRDFPNYQLERRIDIFFAVHMKEILYETCEGFELGMLIPEFPLRKGTTYSKLEGDRKQQNRSTKADYLAFSKDLGRCILIELKTDVTSINKKQLQEMITAKETGLGDLLHDLGTLRKKSNKRNKYDKLIEPLILAKIVYYDEIKELRLCDIHQSLPIELVIICPENGDVVENIKCINFEDITGALKKLGDLDPLTALFRKELLAWKY